VSEDAEGEWMDHNGGAKHLGETNVRDLVLRDWFRGNSKRLRVVEDCVECGSLGGGCDGFGGGNDAVAVKVWGGGVNSWRGGGMGKDGGWRHGREDGTVHGGGCEKFWSREEETHGLCYDWSLYFSI